MNKLISPLNPMPPIPIGTYHPGAFGVNRHLHVHTGVDLYAPYGCPVMAMEDGVVIKVAWFTGLVIGMPWWNDTRAVYVQGASGVFCYGEVQESPVIKEGVKVKQGDVIGYVLSVLRKYKGRPMSMLHLEQYSPGHTDEWDEWKIGEPKPGHLYDPTPFLLTIEGVETIDYDPYIDSVLAYTQYAPKETAEALLRYVKVHDKRNQI